MIGSRSFWTGRPGSSNRPHRVPGLLSFEMRKAVSIAYVLIAVFGAYLMAVFVANRFARPPSFAEATFSAPVEYAHAGDDLRIFTWNIGYAGMGAEADSSWTSASKQDPPMPRWSTATSRRSNRQSQITTQTCSSFRKRRAVVFDPWTGCPRRVAKGIAGIWLDVCP